MKPYREAILKLRQQNRDKQADELCQQASALLMCGYAESDLIAVYGAMEPQVNRLQDICIMPASVIPDPEPPHIG